MIIIKNKNFFRNLDPKKIKKKKRREKSVIFNFKASSNKNKTIVLISKKFKEKYKKK